MKKRLQGMIAGMLIGATITGSTVLAINTTTLYNVIASGIKIFVDGQKLNPTDTNGNKVEPIIYNGTTYLPVRAVANALGKAVYWDGPNYTVYLGDMNGSLKYPTVKIEDMISIADNVCKTDKLIDNYGNSYDYAIYNAYGSTKLQYLCNMKYSKFKGTLYVPKGETATHYVYLTIYADGKIIYKSSEMVKTSAPIDIDVNITGYNDIIIEFSEPSWAGSLSPKICLGNAGFYQ